MIHKGQAPPELALILRFDCIKNEFRVNQLFEIRSEEGCAVMNGTDALWPPHNGSLGIKEGLGVDRGFIKGSWGH